MGSIQERSEKTILEGRVGMSGTLDQDTIVSELHIAVRPERVFQALVEPNQVVQWWGAPQVYRCTHFSSDLRAGGQWQSLGIGPDGNNFEIRGEYLEIDRPHLLVYTWVASWTGDAKATVRWELISTPQGTLVKIRHSGLAAHPELVQSYRGWPRMLGWLQAFLERAETVESRKAS
jgi:uncharacterized protein YndB with AHSA1/START domain